MANNPTNIFVSGDSTMTVDFDITGYNLSNMPTTVDQPLTIIDGGSLGLTSEDGENLNRSVSTTALNAHQEANVRMLVTDGTITISLSALESNAIANRLYWGTSVGTGSEDLDPAALTYVIGYYDTYDIQDGFEKAIRYAGLFSVTPNGDVANQRGGASQFSFTFTSIGKVRRTDVVSGS